MWDPGGIFAYSALKDQRCSMTAYVAVVTGHVIGSRLLGVYRIPTKADICL